jgi:anti-sigma factor RsiW
VRIVRRAQTCPGSRGDLAAYLVGALDWEASAAVRSHLDTCPVCQAEYEDLTSVVGWLALVTSPVATAHCYRASRTTSARFNGALRAPLKPKQ